MATADLSAERLRELLDYNPSTGVFTWRASRSNVRAGSVAGNTSRQGFLHISIDGASYYGHMLAWLYIHGVMPAQKQIAHINGVKTDNRITNLTRRVKSAEREITQERFAAEILYEPNSGEFRWINPSANSLKAGDIAGAIDRHGYRRIKIGRRSYAAHRLAWFMTHGVWPDDEIDHINGIRDDNRLCNLRAVTRAENMHNRKKSWAASGYMGVSANHGRWRAMINVNGRPITVGNFSTPEEAHAAYLQAKRRLHPSFVP